MQVSEARLAANRINALKSKGPTSDHGKMVSRRNATMHALTGDSIVVPEGDAEAIRFRVEALTLEMKPRTAAGAILIGKMATLSVRMERAAEHEAAAIAIKVRHAGDDFDDERHDQADTLLESIAEDPRGVLRKLKRMPEGVEKLVEAWDDLKADLSVEADSSWSDDQLELAANLIGMKSRHAQGSPFGKLNRAIRGDFAGLSARDGAGLSDVARKAWARGELLEAIAAEVAALEAHHATLDFDTLAVDRAEAGSRALFDSSKPACLARRYESEARRGFFRASKEFRQVEAEFAAQSGPTQAHPTPPRPESRMGSFRQTPPPPPREPSPPDPDALLALDPIVPGEDGRPLVYIAPVKKPG